MNYIGTLGPSCRDIKILERMFAAGITGMRLNLSHVSLRQSEDLLETYHRAAQRAGVKPQLIADMQGPELRVGTLSGPVPLQNGEIVTLGEGGIPVPPCLFYSLKPGVEIRLDDGMLLLEAQECEANRATAQVLHGGMLQSRKSISVPEVVVRPPALTDFDLENLSVAAQYGVTAILQPFCTAKEDLIDLREALRKNGLSNALIIAKVETRSGIDALPELIGYADEICIARGDLGNDMPLWELPRVQKEIAAQCRRKGRAFSVATQMLHSMQHSPVPTRAEVSDIFNAVLDGAATLILTGETAVGEYPVETVRYLVNTAQEAQRYLVAIKR